MSHFARIGLPVMASFAAHQRAVEIQAAIA
jgi:hypothetical protein